jgi:hypothetical protein
MVHRHKISERQPVRYRRKIVGGFIIPPSNLVLRSRTNYVPPASMMLKGGKSYVPAFTLKRGGAMPYSTNNLFATSNIVGSAMSRGYY